MSFVGECAFRKESDQAFKWLDHALANG